MRDGREKVRFAFSAPAGRNQLAAAWWPTEFVQARPCDPTRRHNQNARHRALCARSPVRRSDSAAAAASSGCGQTKQTITAASGDVEASSPLSRNVRKLPLMLKDMVGNATSMPVCSESGIGFATMNRMHHQQSIDRVDRVAVFWVKPVACSMGQTMTRHSPPALGAILRRKNGLPTRWALAHPARSSCRSAS